MKTINFLLLSLFIWNCNSIVQLRNSKTETAVRPEEVRPGCYRQVGMLPAVYNNVTMTEVQPGYSETEEVPASQEKKVEKILERPAFNSCSYNGDILFCKEVPAVYKDVTVIIDYPAYKKTIVTPEVKKTVLRPTLVSQERADIRNILCPDKATVSLIQKIQANLRKAGYDPGADDGLLHISTMNAIREYERRNGFKQEERSGEDFIMQSTVNILGG